MRRFLQFIIPIIIILLSAKVAHKIATGAKKPPRQLKPKPVIVVDAMTAIRTDFQVTVKAQGVVQPHTKSTLVAEVSGVVTSVSPNLKVGSFFENGAELMRIDTRDFEIGVEKARSRVSEAILNLAQEKVRTENFSAVIKSAENNVQQSKLKLEEELASTEQARTDWQKLGAGRTAGTLVLRKPQLAAAQAALDAAKAEMEVRQRELTLIGPLIDAAEASVRAAEADLSKAKLDLARCSVKAPYDGRIVTKRVDIGQYVAPGTILAEIYSVEVAEVRLPLANSQIAFIDLPETFASQIESRTNPFPRVILMGAAGSEIHKWEGKIMRSESEIDSASRQHFVIAQVEDPYLKAGTTGAPLKVGLFVHAEIYGKTLENIVLVPITSIRDGKTIWLINENRQLEEQAIQIIWKDETSAAVKGGIKDGDRLCTTALTFAKEGMFVEIAGDGTPEADISEKAEAIRE